MRSLFPIIFTHHLIDQKKVSKLGNLFFLLLTIHNRCPSFFGQNCVLRLRTTTHYILITFFVNLLLNPAKPIKNIWFWFFITLRSLINEHACLIFSRKKNRPACWFFKIINWKFILHANTTSRLDFLSYYPFIQTQPCLFIRVFRIVFFCSSFDKIISNHK